MTIQALISSSIPALSLDSTASQALLAMEELHLAQLPLVHDGIFQGIVAENHLLDLFDDSIKLTEVMPTCGSCFILINQHVLDVLKIAQEHQLSIVAVLDEDRSYLGCVNVTDVALALGKEYFMIYDGGTIVLSLQERDYSLSEISRLVESNNTKILHAYTSYDPENSLKVRLTLKLNETDIGRVVATLERFNYEIVERFGTSSIPDLDQERLGSLLRYLSI
jgi:CBS domain-containing protein